jgi:hypothetical protein
VAFSERGPANGPVVGEGPSGDPMSVTVAWDPGEWPNGLQEIVTCLSVGGHALPALSSITVAPPNAGSVTVNFFLPAGDPGSLVCEDSVLIGTGSTEGRRRPTTPVCFKLRAAEDAAAPAGPPGPGGSLPAGRPHATPPAVMPPMTPAAPLPPARIRRPETPPAARAPLPAARPPAARRQPTAPGPTLPAAGPTLPAAPAVPAPPAAGPASPAPRTLPTAGPTELARRFPPILSGPDWPWPARQADPGSAAPSRAGLEAAPGAALPSGAAMTAPTAGARVSGAGAAVSGTRPSSARVASGFTARPLTSDGRPVAATRPPLPATGGAAVGALPRTGLNDHIPLAGGGGLLAIGGAAIVLAEPRRRSRRPRRA